MNKIFTEFENENSLRSYPFASGCSITDTDGNSIGSGILIDAALYPVNSIGNLYLSSIDTSGTISISDSQKVIMTSVHEPGSDMLEFYDTTELRRHVGTMIASSSEALDVLVNGTKDRKFKQDATLFASACVFAVTNDGVLSIDVDGTGQTDGIVEFTNSSEDEIRVSTNGSNLRFDIVPLPELHIPTSIQHIYCIVDGKTPFRIQKLQNGLFDGDHIGSAPGNTVVVYLDNIERSDVCSNAHRENTLEMTDTCECSSSPEEPEQIEIPEFYQEEVVDIPNGCDSAFYLAVPNIGSYDNPLSLTLVNGEIRPKTESQIAVSLNNTDVGTNILADNITSKGVILQVPGLSH